MISKVALFSLFVCKTSAAAAAAGADTAFQKLTRKKEGAGTCLTLKDAYKKHACCGNPSKQTNEMLIPMNAHKSKTPNPCEGTKPAPGSGFDNKPCFLNDVLNSMEQAGANVTKGYQGSLISSSSGPITDPYWKVGLCPVNVHWHLGTEHYSAGEYDENGKGPTHHVYVAGNDSGFGRRLADEARVGFRCRHYDKNDPKFTTEYEWDHCADMYVGETYEVHWPHSAVGACHTPNQYQTPFYDGVFCLLGPFLAANGLQVSDVETNKAIGVQSQVFTVVNDETYYYPDLMRGMIVDGAYGADMAMYTGSTTGTSRDNTVCSGYAPITWQVDRKCHLISASSFDKMCADMKSQKDDMTHDLYPHGSRVLVADNLAANNQQP
jgi:hypothetical protein